MYIVGKIKAERGTKLNALNLSETSESNGITKATAINPLPISVKYLKIWVIKFTIKNVVIDNRNLARNAGLSPMRKKECQDVMYLLNHS